MKADVEADMFTPVTLAERQSGKIKGSFFLIIIIKLKG